jgi:hypothetical protein
MYSFNQSINQSNEPKKMSQKHRNIPPAQAPQQSTFSWLLRSGGLVDELADNRNLGARF